MAEPLDRGQKAATSATFVGLVLASGVLQALFESSEGPLRWLFLILASIAVGVIPFTPRWPKFVQWARTVRWRRWLVWTLVMTSTVVLGAVAVPLAAIRTEYLRIWFWGCPKATQLTLVAAPEDVITAREIANAFEADTAGRRYGCPTVDIQVYSEAPRLVGAALAGGWSPDDLRSTGPRPDLWLPGSMRQAQIKADPLVPAEMTTIASTPVVLAVPPSLLVDPRLLDTRRERTWKALLDLAQNQHWSVHRPDPQLSAAAELATVKIYTSEVALIDSRRARELERFLSPPGSPPATGVDLLCGQPAGALIVTEQQLVRYNAGLALGCPNPGVPDRAWQGFYPIDLAAMRMPLISFTWPDAGDDQPERIGEFVRWLGTTSGRDALIDSGLRPADGGHMRDPLSERFGAQPVSYGPEPLPEDYAKVAERRAIAQRPARILLAIDASGSMRLPISVDGPTRFDLAKQGIEGALRHLGPGDELALWSFQGSGKPNRLTQNFTAGGTAIPSALSTVAPEGDTPLYQSIVEGVAELASPDQKWVTALVVLTDGEDSGSGTSGQQMVDAVKNRGVKVFVVATGEASCATRAIIDVTGQTGGRCYPVGEASLNTKLSELFLVLWGGS